MNGRSVSGRRACELSKLGVGRTFQQLSVFPRMSVLDNIILAGQEHRGGLLSRLLGAPDAGLTTEANQLIEFFRLTHLTNEWRALCPTGNRSWSTRRWPPWRDQASFFWTNRPAGRT